MIEMALNGVPWVSTGSVYVCEGVCLWMDGRE